MMTCVKIETPRLLLEPLEACHAEVLFEGLRDARLYEFIDDAPPESVQSLQRRYAILAGHHSPDGLEAWLNWAVRVVSTGRHVGLVQATVGGSRSALIAYVLFHAAWGNGYGREAVAAMIGHLLDSRAVNTVCALVDPRNEPSLALLRTLGFSLHQHTTGMARLHGNVADELEFRLEGVPASTATLR
jgi:ribosomal-protein-alanine N-acetyltransferase